MASRVTRFLRGDLVDQTLGLIVMPSARPSVSGQARRLDVLFKELRRADPVRDPDEVVELIWAMWIAHPEQRATSSMIAAVEAMAAGARDLARPILDRLVDEFPEWAEAWNKRATLAFIEKRDNDSMSDIARTLELEPRHFGAIVGFGQICLRHNRPQEAKAAFEVALRLNPHMDGLADIVADLEAVTHRRH
jgi:predicted Zn-dependent protease